MSKKKKIFIGILLGFLLLVLGCFGFVYGKLSKIQRVSPEDQVRIPREEEDFETEEGILSAEEIQEEESLEVQWNGVELLKSKDVVNILLIGQDRRPGQGRQRSDTMIICSIQKDTNEIILTSIMRDCYVQIPGYSDNRINAAYAFGGMELLDETIELNFGIPIHGNVEVDFDGFIEALTVVGNLELNLTAQEAANMQQGGAWNLKSGVNSMTPEQVLWYARMRNIGRSDWDRTERQRKVITAALKKVEHLDVLELIDLADEILPCVTTDMTNGEIVSLIYDVVSENISALRSQRVPIDGAYYSASIHGMSVLVPDLIENNEYLKDTIYENMK